MRRLGYRNRNTHEGRARVPRKSRRKPAAMFTGAVVVMTTAIALPGIGTSEARIDPNRYGLRTVSAAGGSVTTVAVRFTVRPVILLVVGRDGTPRELWSNVAGQPSAADLRALRVRVGDVHGADLAVTAALRSAAGVPLADARWGAQGLVWRR
ncbi:MAG: hypothetical protein QOF08_1292 [Gaiellales bacterium]|nr:hypothetical protein [Gaiellales bacterium]